MHYHQRARAHRVLFHRGDLLHRILADPPGYPEWNPGLERIEKADDGGFHIVTKRLLRGRLTIATTSHHVAVTIDLPGLHEISHWELHDDGARTHITHALRWRGALVSVIDTDVIRAQPAKRLLRLNTAAEQLRATLAN
ncbi:MAG: hypothetical protein Q4Q03_06610 [Bowdeniella nasicola]|nr:hypothetical protein [Bowdeniella nasicola]